MHCNRLPTLVHPLQSFVCMSLERFARKEMVVANLHESSAEVAARMKERHVGAVVVVQDARPIGIVTDRDLVTRVLATRATKDTPIGDIMTANPETVRTGDSLDTAVARMRERGVRRLPIVDREGRLAGMVTLDDVLVLLAAEQTALANAVRANKGP
jgi:CBS domain-containing protein